MVVLTTFLALACQPNKNVHYLVIVDKVTPDIVSGFEKKFFAGEKALVNRPSIGFGDISFTVFLPTAAGEMHTVTFPANNVEQKQRKKDAKEFIAFLNAHNADTSKERYVLRSLDRLFDNITDSTTDYHILNAGGLIENSGGAVSLTTQPMDWLNGNFCFSNGIECMTDPVKAARDQLHQGPGWLFDDLIASNKANALLNRQTIYYQPIHSGLYQTINGCGARDVELFWQELYKRLNISAKPYTKSVTSFLNE